MYVKESQKLFEELGRLVHISLEETFSYQTPLSKNINVCEHIQKHIKPKSWHYEIDLRRYF